jgi:hypothetical protein
MTSSRTGAKSANAGTATELPVAMTGRASPAKVAEGDQPSTGPSSSAVLLLSLAMASRQGWVA